MSAIDKIANNTAIPSYYSTNDIGGKVQKVTDANVIKVLNQFNLVAREGWVGIFRDVWRSFTWSMITGTAWIADTVSMLSTGILTFLNFYTYQPVVDFLQEFQVFIILGSIFFFGIAWIAAMSKKEIPVVDMLKNGAFAWFTYFVLPILMMVGVGFVQNVSQAISTHNTPSSSIIKDNVYDIRAIDKANWDLTAINKVREEGNGAPNFIDQYKDKNGDLTVQSKELKYIDPTERLKNDDVKKLSEFGQEVASKKLHLDVSKSDDFKKKWEVVPLEQNTFKEDGHYYTYTWNWWTIELSLWAVIIFTAILLIRMARIEVEIFMHWVVGDVIALSQWGTTKRNWEVISKIGMGFTTLIFTQGLSVLFTIGILQLNDLLQGGKINFLMYLILLFAFGMEMIDGPALWQQLFNIDAGIKSGWQNAWGAAMLTKQLNDMINPFSAQRRYQRSMAQNAKSNRQSSKYSEQPEQKTDSNQGFNTQANNTSGMDKERPENKATGQNNTAEQNNTGNNTQSSQNDKQPENQSENKNQPEGKNGEGQENTAPSNLDDNSSDEQDSKKDDPTSHPEIKVPGVPGQDSQSDDSQDDPTVTVAPVPEMPPLPKSNGTEANPFEAPEDEFWMNDNNIPEDSSQPEYNTPWEGFE